MALREMAITSLRKKPRLAKPPPAQHRILSGPANSRADILKAATRLFAAKPYDAVVIRDIAKMANVGSPTIYHFFKSKSGLYREALLSYYGKRVANTAALPAREAPARTRIYAFVSQQLQALANDEKFFQLLQRELLSEDEGFKKELAAKLLVSLYAYLDDILASTKFGRGNTVMPTLIMSMVLGYFQIARFQKYLPVYAGKPVNELPYLQQLAEQLANFIDPLVTS